MAASGERLVLSVARFKSARPMDGGFMISVHLLGPDDREIVLLLPPESLDELTTGLTEAAAAAGEMRLARGED